MNDKSAHRKLKEIQEKVNSFKNSRREKNERHEKFNEAMNEIKKLNIKKSA